MRCLDDIVSRHDLNQHPFYVAWRAGTLPAETLGVYAAHYAPFIASVETGWGTLGDDGHAATERAHARLWEAFRAEAGSEASEAELPDEAEALVEIARRAFADPVTAIGALYAFEAQQPGTTSSKLSGLREHYAFSEAGAAYFRAHADDYGEREDLSRRASSLNPDELARAEAACKQTCLALWRLLDGVLRTSPPRTGGAAS